MDGANHLKLGLNQTAWERAVFNSVRRCDCSGGGGRASMIKSLISGTRSLLAAQKFPVRLLKEFLDKCLQHKELCVSALRRDR